MASAEKEIQSQGDSAPQTVEETTKGSSEIGSQDNKPQSSPENETKDTAITSNVDDVDDVDSPPFPPRPVAPKHLTQVEINIAELTDMFPNVDPKYIKMALIASEGRLEPASNALLFLSDPESGIEIPDPSHHVTVGGQGAAASNHSIESDEALARRLARSYESRAKPPKSSRPTKPSKPARLSEHSARRSSTSMSSDHPHNEFLDVNNDSDEDLYEAVTKGVTEVKEVVGGWFGNVAKKIQQSIDQPQNGAQVQPTNQQRKSKPHQYRDDVREFDDIPPRLPPKDSYYKRQMENHQNSPYQQQPQSSQRGGHVHDDYDSETNDAPHLPSRHKNLYSAMNASNSSLPHSSNVKSNADELKPKIQQQISLDDNDTEHEVDAANSADRKSPAKTEGTPIDHKNEVEVKPKQTLLAAADPEPSNDAFLVEDSEDDDEIKR